jgi:hypothetical protein
MSENANSVWDSDVVKSFEEESSGGGGWICWTNIQLGYKIFAKGYDNNETFLPFDVGNAQDKERAKREALKFVDKVNAESVEKVKAPTNAIRIELDKEKTYNKDTSTWQGNRIQDTPVWTDAYKEVIFPHLKDANADLGWQWARISFEKDPYKPTRINQLTGEEVANLVMYVAETYLTKQDALDAAAELEGSKSDDGSSPVAQQETATTQSDDVPDGYDEESWNSVIPLIKEEIANGKAVKEIADDYGVSIPDVVKLKQ